MEMNTQDYVKKALLDTQERVRDYSNYADQVDDKKLASFFKNCALMEGKQAQHLKKFLDGDVH